MKLLPKQLGLTDLCWSTKMLFETMKYDWDWLTSAVKYDWDWLTCAGQLKCFLKQWIDIKCFLVWLVLFFVLFTKNKFLQCFSFVDTNKKKNNSFL